MNIGQRVRERREILKITQNELALAVGMTSQYISLIEQGKNIPSLAVVSKLAEQLGTSIDYLVSGKEGIITDVIPAIKADKVLNIEAKKSLITMVKLLREASNKSNKPHEDVK